MWYTLTSQIGAPLSVRTSASACAPNVWELAPVVTWASRSGADTVDSSVGGFCSNMPGWVVEVPPELLFPPLLLPLLSPPPPQAASSEAASTMITCNVERISTTLRQQRRCGKCGKELFAVGLRPTSAVRRLPLGFGSDGAAGDHFHQLPGYPLVDLRLVLQLHRVTDQRFYPGGGEMQLHLRFCPADGTGGGGGLDLLRLLDDLLVIVLDDVDHRRHQLLLHRHV